MTGTGRSRGQLFHEQVQEGWASLNMGRLGCKSTGHFSSLVFIAGQLLLKQGEGRACTADQLAFICAQIRKLKSITMLVMIPQKGPDANWAGNHGH